MSDYTAMLAYPHAHTVYQGFAQSLAWEMRTNPHITTIHAERCYPGDDLALGRNRIMQKFLDSQVDWLLMVDTDIVFPQRTLSTLISTAEDYPSDVLPVVSGHYKIQLEHHSHWRGVPAETQAMDACWLYSAAGYTPYQPRVTGERRVFRVDATGAGCLAIHRSTAEAFTDSSWFSILKLDDGRSFGEDLSFCYRLGMKGVPLLLDTAVRLIHFKENWI